MSASNIYFVMDPGVPVAAFTARQELKPCLRRRFDTFCNALVYTLADGHGPTIMTRSRALVE
jgi:hypothetical protein